MRDEFEILGEAFAEANSRVDDNLRFLEARGTGGFNGVAKAVGYIADGVSSESYFLHGFGPPAHMHENYGDFQAGGSARHFRIELEAADVVYDLRASGHS